MSKNNIKINNISPFLNRNVILNTENDLIKNILLNNLPLLPGINFYDKEFNINGVSNTINEKPPKKIDPIGSLIINAYYNIKVNLRKLELIKTFIISIIKCNENYFKKIIIYKQSYSILERKLIIKFKDTFNQTFKQMNDIEQDIKLNEGSKIGKKIFSVKNYVNTSVTSYIDKSTGTNLSSKKKDFPMFVKNFIENKYGLIDKNNETAPFFFRIFLRTYNGKNKLFFKTLFNQYIQIRNNLLKYLVKDNINYGILAFSFVFDLPREKFIEIESNNKKNTNTNNNLNNYIVLNNTNINNKINIKVGDIVNINDDTIINIIIDIIVQDVKKYMKESGKINISIDELHESINIILNNLLSNKNDVLNINFNENNNISIYDLWNKIDDYVKNLLKNNNFLTLKDSLLKKFKKGTVIKIDYDNSAKPYLIRTEINTKKYSKEELDFDIDKLPKKKPKKLNQKISENDLLYRNVFDKQMFKDNYLKNINKKYSDLLESTKNFIGPISTQSFSLDDLIKNNIEADYNIFNFIFNYVDPLLFDKAVDENYLIKDNISSRMDQFDLYYDQYIDWFNKLKGITGDINNSNYGLNISDFERFFDKILKNVITVPSL